MLRVHVVELFLRKIYIYTSFSLVFCLKILVTSGERTTSCHASTDHQQKCSFLPFGSNKQGKSLLGFQMGRCDVCVTTFKVNHYKIITHRMFRLTLSAYVFYSNIYTYNIYNIYIYNVYIYNIYIRGLQVIHDKQSA